MKRYTIELEEDHLIVLSDLLYRISESNILNDFVVDKSELKAIWVLEGILEKMTSSILSGDYVKILKDARVRYRDED